MNYIKTKQNGSSNTIILIFVFILVFGGFYLLKESYDSKIKDLNQQQDKLEEEIRYARFDNVDCNEICEEFKVKDNLWKNGHCIGQKRVNTNGESIGCSCDCTIPGDGEFGLGTAMGGFSVDIDEIFN